MRLELKLGRRGIEIPIVHKNITIFLIWFILIFGKAKQLCTWEGESGHWGSGLGLWGLQGANVMSATLSNTSLSPTLWSLWTVCFVPALCIEHWAPQAPAENR